MKNKLLILLVLCMPFIIRCSSSDSIEESVTQTIKKDTITTDIGDGSDITFTEEQLKLPAKKGACQKGLSKVALLNAHWNYTWGSTYPTDQIGTSEFIPMKWGGGGDKAAFYEAMKKMIANGQCKRLLAFNEPDTKDQANMTVAKAIEWWPTFQSLGIPLGSPAAVNAKGSKWLEEFMHDCDSLGYRVDYITVHNYLSYANPKMFENLLTTIHEKYNRPIIVTEFAVADLAAKTIDENRYTPERVLNFMKQVLPWMEKTDFIYGYAWFSFGIKDKRGTSSALFDANGNLTELGQYYSDFVY